MYYCMCALVESEDVATLQEAEALEDTDTSQAEGQEYDMH